MSPDTLLFLQELLGRVQLPANHPDFDQQAAMISKVRRELDEAIQATVPK